MKDKDFQNFVKYLIKAIEKMDAHYFQLPIAEGEEPIYRERVYCYELYHQLRCILDDNFSYKLNGEVDKSGHPLIRNAKKPDFIIHQPGDMEHNLVVIEVKPVTVESRISKLREDIETLKWFLDNANYYQAIMLIYGNVNGYFPENIKTEVENISDGKIMILWHSDSYGKSEIIKGKGYIA